HRARDVLRLPLKRASQNSHLPERCKSAALVKFDVLGLMFDVTEKLLQPSKRSLKIRRRIRKPLQQHSDIDGAGLTSPDKSNFKHQTPNIPKDSFYLRNPRNPVDSMSEINLWRVQKSFYAAEYFLRHMNWQIPPACAVARSSIALALPR